MSQQEISLDDWQAKGKELFGEDYMRWRFVCPGCGNIATVEDFRQFKDKGASPNDAVQACIGRFSGGDWAKKTKPCNYAAYGLLHLSPLVVVDEEGNKTQAFGFDGWPVLQSANAEKPQPSNDR